MSNIKRKSIPVPKRRYRYVLIALVMSCLIPPARLMAGEVLTWEDCVREALAHHPELMAAKEKVRQAREDKNVSVSDALPQVTSEISQKKTRTAGSSETNTYAVSVSGEQLLFDGFKTSSDIHAAVKTLDAQQYTYMVTSSDIRLNLRSAFAALLRAQELISLTEQIAKRRKENLDLVRVRYDAGREHKGALLTAEADLAQAQFEVAQANRNLSLAQQNLTKELGRDQSGPLKVVGDFTAEETDEANPDSEALAESTPFLKTLIAKKEAARFNYSSKKAEFFPEVYLSGSFGRSRSQWPPRDDAWTAGLTVSLPVFEGGSRIDQMKKAKSQWSEAEANEQSGRDTVIYTLEKTWKDFRDADGTVAVKKKYLDAAVERENIASAQYSSGLTTFDDWIIIENNLVSAQKTYLDARENLLVAEAYWVQAKGGVLENVQE